MRLTTQKGFSGIDTRVSLAEGLTAASHMLNLRVTDSGSLAKRPCIRKVHTFSGNVDGIWCGMLGNTYTVAVVASGKLYTVDPATATGVYLIGNACYGKCEIFEFNGALYIKSDSYYGKFDGKSITPVEGYIPCVAISCTPDGKGEIYEQINLLSDKRRQRFSSDGESVLYTLAEQDIDSIDKILVDGVEYDGNYSLDNGSRVSFQSPPPEGLNNVEITYVKATKQSDRDRIMKCTRVMLFGGNSDGRAFLWGNDELPNHRFHSELADGVPSVEYFPVNAFTVIGNSKINCIVQQYDKQLIFTKNEAYYSYAELLKDGLDNLYTSFPVFSLNASKGCLIESSGCVIDNRPVTLCDDGLNMWESTSIENERNAVCFSHPVDKLLRSATAAELDTANMLDFQAHRELYFILGDIALVYNYGNGAWYCFNGFAGDRFSVCGSKMFLSNGSSLYVFCDENGVSDDECVWSSPFITNSQAAFNCDVTLFESDLHASGPITLKLDFVKGNGEAKTRTFSFDKDTDRLLRISARPSLKRAMPFSLRITGLGGGSLTIHGISIKTRKKERSQKYGIL